MFPRAAVLLLESNGQDDVRDKTSFVTTKDIRERDRVMVDKLCGLRTDLTIFRTTCAKMIINHCITIQYVSLLNRKHYSNSRNRSFVDLDLYVIFS